MSNIALTSTTLSGFLETDFQQFKDVIQDGGVNAIVLDVNQTGTSGVGATLRRDLASGSTDNSVVKITQDNAGDDQPALSIQQDGNADALQINTTATMDGEYGIRIDATSASTTVDAAGGIRIAGGSARGIYCVRDSTSAYTTGAVAAIIQTNAGDDQDALKIQQDGTSGYSLYLQHVGNDSARSALAIIRKDNSANYTTVNLCAALTSANGSNWFYRNLPSTHTAGPVVFIEQDNAGDDQAVLKITQTADVKVIDFDTCIDQGTSHTTLAGSIKIEMPNGSTGYLNFYT